MHCDFAACSHRPEMLVRRAFNAVACRLYIALYNVRDVVDVAIKSFGDVLSAVHQSCM